MNDDDDTVVDSNPKTIPTPTQLTLWKPHDSHDIT